MKKMSVIISLLVVALILVFTAEPCLSQALKEDFAGYRFRLAEAVPGTINDFACRRHVNGQEAEWQVKVGHPLVDGYWINTDTKTRYPIASFTKGGITTPCDPSVGPPEKPYTITTGVPYIVFGPFTLTPPAADGGYWEGMWKTQGDTDHNRILTAEAKGHGGLLEGKSLHISVVNPPVSTQTWCPCPGCPTAPFPNPAAPTKNITSTMCFDGWVLTPTSAQ